MSTRSERFWIFLSVVAALLVVALLVVRAAAPAWLRRTLESTVSELLGRELKISGTLRISLSAAPSLTVSDVTLANASWGSGPAMVRVGRIRVSVDLASLWSGSLRVRDVDLKNVRVLLEADDEGRRNWSFAVKRRGLPETKAEKGPVVLERASIRDFELIYRPPREAPPVTLGIDALDAALDPATLMVNIRGAGRLGDAPWDIAGRVGSLTRLYEGRDLDPVLTGHIGSSTLSISGRILEPRTLGGPHLEVDVEGPNVASALGVFGLRSPLTGAFRFHGLFAQKGEEVDVDVNAAVGGVTATVRGTVNAILTAERIDATIDAAGPDASQVGAWTGIVGLPPRPFDVAGRFRRDGPRLSFEDLKVHVGGTSVTVGGKLGELPRCVGTDLTVAATGTDLSQLSALTRLDLPSGAFELRGRFLRRAEGLAIEGTTLTVRGAAIHAAGTIGEPPRLANLDLTAGAAGPDASILSGVATVALPAEPFELRGRVARKEAHLELDDVSGRLGADNFAVSGELAPKRGLVGSDARVNLSGPDLDEAVSRIGLHGLPAERFEGVGRIRIATDHVQLEEVDASVGGLTVRLDGEVGSPSPRDRTSLICRARGESLSGLTAWGVPAKLPPDRFAASGTLRIERGVYSVDGLSAEVGADHLTLDGTLGALPDVEGLDLAVTASGPSLAGVGRFATAADIDPPTRIPQEPFTVTGQIRRAPSGVEIRSGVLDVAGAKVGADGVVSFAERGVGTDLTFDAEAPDTALLSDLVGAPLPDGALRSHGRMRRLATGYRFDDAEITVGASFAELSGILGEPPMLSGTDMDVSVEGPDLASFLEPLSGPAPLPAESFALSAHVVGSRDNVTADRLAARLGDSDLAGTLAMSLVGRVSVDADLSSKHLDVPALISGFTREPDAETSPASPATKSSRKRERLIPDWPLRLGALRTFDARLRLVAAQLPLPGIPIRDVVVAGELKDGAVTIDRSEGTGKNGGRWTSSLSLRPEGSGYRLQHEGRFEGGRLDLSKTGESPELAPSLDVEFEFEGAGDSLHGIAANADGRVLVMVGPGRIPNTWTDFMSSNILIALLDAMNPFRKSSPYTALECGIAAAGIDAGKMVVRPIAARTDKMTVLGNGKLDLDSERIDLVWTIKPRRGVGLSGGSITNPYIKLGGTLANPALDLKPLEAVASTGAAVATAGLTILFRGFYDRITAEKKVCVEALAKARKQADERAARKAN
jgi:hypothetical protein